jgi:DNA end-binding protein Ku
MARAIWKGAISFGLVTVPVALFPAVERRERIAFRQLHAKDESPIDYKRFCEEENVEVPWSEIVKGYEYEKGRYVVVTDKDLAKAKAVATETFDVRDFVPAADIDPMFFDQPYYLTPGAKSASKAYALLRDALEKTGRVGVGTIVLRQREHLAALQPAGQALVLTMMRFAHELRSPRGLELPAKGHAYSKKELELGVKLVENLAAEWNPSEYKDTYHEILMQVIQQKIAGKPIHVKAPRRPPQVRSLMKALEASLERGGRRPAARMPSRAAQRRRAA